MSTTTRARSLGGCATCRSRHVKCDETRPTCRICERAKLSCMGYGTRLAFDASDLQGNPNFRRPVYSEAERMSMTELLRASVPASDPEKLLVLLDRECERNQHLRLTDSSVSLGPFTVFHVYARGLSHEPEPLLEDDGTLGDNTAENLVRLAGNVSDAAPSGLTDSLVDLLFDPVLIDPTCSQQLHFDYADTYLSSFPPLPLDDDLNTLPGNFGFSNLQTMSALPPVLKHDLPGDVVHLLQHFSKSVVLVLSPPQYQKSPWHILFSSNVMNTMGALATGLEVSNIQLSIFYSVLSISSYSLRRSGTDDYKFRESRGAFFETKAHEYLKLTLRSMSLNGSAKVAKYKEILMALLGLVSTSIYGGHQQRAEFCLLDAERAIRSKGLTKPRMSRKARLLHHLYTYLRIMHESTRGALEITGRKQLLLNRSSPKHRLSSAEPYFRLDPSWSRLEQSLSTTEKETWVGEQDLHLSVPGRWYRTLYPDVVGIPESWMQLLSQCIRLGNEVDIAKHSPESSTMSLSLFMSRAKDLENCLVRWDPMSQHDWGFVDDVYGHNDDGDQNSEAESPIDHPLKYLKAALHQALLIYFFRRLHDLDATFLQDKVERVLKILNDHSEASTGDHYLSSFVWPGFIAACEALNVATQAGFRSWFDSCANKTGLESFSEARKIAELVWAERRKSNSRNFSWREVLSNTGGLKLFFS